MNEQFHELKVEPERLDSLLENGWRHFGEYFFRHDYDFYKNETIPVIPVRIRLKNFAFSKSQRRLLRKNQDLQTFIRRIRIDPQTKEIFERHRWRFEDRIPNSIYEFISYNPSKIPCEALEVAVYKDEKLLAKSFFDVGKESISSTYAIFAPEEKKRGLGILTMLLEIDFAIQNAKKFYYPGYVHEISSFYDYKKRFRNLEKFDWKNEWKPWNEK